MGTFWTPSAYIHRSLHKAIEYAAELSLCSCLRPLGETATRTVRLSPSRPGGEGCHEGTGDRHMDPDCPCSLLIRVIPPGCPTGRLWGIFTGQCSMELWPVNCAIRCRLRHDDGTMQAPSGARLPSVAPSRCACTMGRGSDPALFPWTGVHSLGSSL